MFDKSWCTQPTFIPAGSFTWLHLAAKRALYLELFKMIHVGLHAK
jgi:hypothetical protein